MTEILAIIGTWPEWAISAVAGAVGGVVGTLVGHGLYKASGWKVFQLVPVVTLVLAVTLARETIVPAAIQAAASKPAGLEQLLSKSGLKMYDQIRISLPDEYDTMIAALAAISDKSSDAAFDDAARIAGALRKKYAGYVKSAPDALKIDALKANLKLLETVRERETPEVCGKFAVESPLEVAKKPTYLTLMDDAATKLFRAIGEGFKTPAPVSAATPEDWEGLVASMRAEGVTEAEIGSMAAPDKNDPLACPAAIKFIRAVIQAPDEAGKRLRSEILYGITAG